ncbi:hypothetical protein NQS96_05815 [Pseudoalteromonas shioyasakiensis]|uniref:O-unit flippase-like protein n=1 Tax=Pseudoalteromonas shioyasakiensis TaxID=1190813 RepID=UPI00211769A0|nr:O-unit flippase-like protein [Pseudoalteromonas shioyasakiensis]MCQ8881320.1 hypothetical protein [Pseudoalteromonas shioyasakiensis]
MALFWGYFSRFSSLASSLIIMPFALANFTEAEFSLWMIFVAFYGLIVVFDFGLSSTFSRQMNYVLCGAQTLEKQGVSGEFDKSNINYALFSTVIDSAKFIFLIIAVLTTLILSFAYFFYLETVASNSGLNIQYEWLLYSVAVVINIFCLMYNALFFGTNNVASIYKVTSYNNIAFFIVAISMILNGYTLIAIAVARVVSAFIYFLASKYEINKYKMLHGYQSVTFDKVKPTLLKILPNASRIGVVSLGNFMLTKISILIIAYYFSASDSATYSLALNLFTILSAVSLLYMTVVTPSLNRAMQEKSYQTVKRVQSRVRLVSMLLVVLGCVGISFIGPFLLKLIGSETSLPELSSLLFFSLMILLDVNRQVSMNFIAANNHVPFSKAIVFSGCITLLATIALFELGYQYFILPIIIQIIVQSTFNNWYWTVVEKRTLKQMSVNTA